MVFSKDFRRTTNREQNGPHRGGCAYNLMEGHRDHIEGNIGDGLYVLHHVDRRQTKCKGNAGREGGWDGGQGRARGQRKQGKPK